VSGQRHVPATLYQRKYPCATEQEAVGHDAVWRSEKPCHAVKTKENNIIIALMMEAVRTYETLVYFNETTRQHRYPHRPENLKPHTSLSVYWGKFYTFVPT
jgi:hypothetical protein